MTLISDFPLPNRAVSSDTCAVGQVSSSSNVELEPRIPDRQIEQVSSCSLPAPPDVLLLY